MDFNDISNFLIDGLIGCNGYPFVHNVIDEIQVAITKRPNKTINYDSLMSDLKLRNIVGMDYPLSYIRKGVIVAIGKGEYDVKINESRSTSAEYPYDLLKIADINYTLYERSVIGEYVIYIAEHGLMQASELRSLYGQIIEWLGKNNRKTGTDFITIFKTCKTIGKLHLPYKDIEKKADEEEREFCKMIATIENRPFDEIYEYRKKTLRNSVC